MRDREMVFVLKGLGRSKSVRCNMTLLNFLPSVGFS